MVEAVQYPQTSLKTPFRFPFVPHIPTFWAFPGFLTTSTDLFLWEYLFHSTIHVFNKTRFQQDILKKKLPQHTFSICIKEIYFNYHT